MSTYEQGYAEAFHLIEEILALPSELAKKGVVLDKCPDKFGSIEKVRSLLLPLFTMTMAHKEFVYFRASLMNYLHLHANCKGGEHVANFAFAHYLAMGAEDYADKFATLFQSQAFHTDSAYILKTITQDFSSFFIEDRWKRVSKRINLLKEAGVNLNFPIPTLYGSEQHLTDILSEYEPDSESDDARYRKALSLFEKSGLRIQKALDN